MGRREEAQALPYRILVVEDEPDTRDLLDFTLRAAGYRVDSATSARDALELLADHGYDVILSDLRMPEITGEELYRRIEHGWPHLTPRVAFVSGSRPSDGFQAQYGGRFVPLITKPYTAEPTCAPTAPNSSARWPSTRTGTGSATCEALRASSSRMAEELF